LGTYSSYCLAGVIIMTSFPTIMNEQRVIV
jgi:hypothetical protein